MTGPTGPGPLGEEAARLLEAVGMWARSNLRAPQATGDGGHESWHEQVGESLGAGIADGSPACRLCPVCQLIAVLRTARPETFTHLLEASAAFTAALRSVVEHAGSDAERRRGGVERIDLDPPAGDGWGARPGSTGRDEAGPEGQQEAAPA